jgi:putative tricarboxylic transport membrane protein
MEMKKIDRVIGFVFLVFVIILYLINNTYPHDVKGYTQGLLILLGVSSSYLIFRTKSKNLGKRFNGKIENVSLSRILTLFISLVIYIIGIYFIGYFLITVVFITTSLILLNMKNWKVILVTNIFLVSIMYILFILFLKLQLPPGIFFGD